MRLRSMVAALAGVFMACGVFAHDNVFVYVVEPKASNEGEAEFEQWVTGRFGHQNGAYSAWDFREEVEYGLTEKAGLALHFDYSDVRQDKGDEHGWNFEEAGAEWTYQFSDPYSDAVGSLFYLEYSRHTHSDELEEKLVLGKEWERWRADFNTVVSEEWAASGNGSVLSFAGGVSRVVAKGWALGIEALHRRTFDGASLNDEQYSATFAGPSIHFTNGHRFHAVLAVMPQVFGDGTGSANGLQLDHEERLQTRLVASYEF